MSRVPYPTREEFPVEYLPAYDQMLRERGNPATHVWLAIANVPNLLGPMLDFTKEMRFGSVVDQRLRELAIMTVAHVTRSHYEYDHHLVFALKEGVRRAQLEQLDDAQTSPEFDERERAVVRYAREATESIEVSDATWSALVGNLGLREAMDILMATAWYNAVARMLGPLQVENEEWFVEKHLKPVNWVRRAAE